jgi:hypothetical protein
MGTCAPTHAPVAPTQDDGDQSFFVNGPADVLSGAGQWVKDLQGQLGLQMHTRAMVQQLPCDAFRAAFLGHAAAFKAAFKPREHLPMRAWRLRLGLASLVVSGAQRVPYMQREGLDPNADGHAEILEEVCRSGARVDARDIAGWTAFHHAVAHHTQLDLARILLRHGADPTAQDRWAGADGRVAAGDGCTCTCTHTHEHERSTCNLP